MNEIPKPWADLIEGLTILGSGPRSNPVSPTHCEHDELMVMADPADFTAEQIERLDELGFAANYSEGYFYAFRFGSA